MKFCVVYPKAPSGLLDGRLGKLSSIKCLFQLAMFAVHNYPWDTRYIKGVGWRSACLMEGSVGQWGCWRCAELSVGWNGIVKIGWRPQNYVNCSGLVRILYFM